MAAKRRSRQPLKVGPRGPRGRRGPPGRPANGELRRLAAQVAEVVKELQLQLTRIGQMQAQLDRLATGQSPDPPRRDRQRTDN